MSLNTFIYITKNLYYTVHYIIFIKLYDKKHTTGRHLRYLYHTYTKEISCSRYI